MNLSQKSRVRRHEDLLTLLAAIDDAGIPDAKIAAQAGVSYNTIYWWRAGKVRCGRHETMANVAAALGLSYRLLRTNR